jgi:hypothetical protein
MQTTERPPSAPSSRPSPVRGVVLVAVAVVLGFFILRAIDDTDADTAVDTAAGPGNETTVGADAPAGTEAAAPTPRAPAEVIVIVANASGVQGAAAEQTERIASGGYQTAPAGNAPEGTQLQTTQVMPTAGFEAEAAALAAAIGAPESAVQPLPEPPPVDLAGANILVMLGTDLAQGL